MSAGGAGQWSLQGQQCHQEEQDSGHCGVVVAAMPQSAGAGQCPLGGVAVVTMPPGVQEEQGSGHFRGSNVTRKIRAVVTVVW